MDAMRDDLDHRLREAGYRDVEIKVVLEPAWTTDWITDSGRRKLAEAGIAPPGAAPRRPAGPIPLTLGPPIRVVACPRCGSADTVELSGSARPRARRCGGAGPAPNLSSMSRRSEWPPRFMRSRCPKWSDCATTPSPSPSTCPMS